MLKRLAIVGLAAAGAFVLLPWALGWARYDYGFVDSQIAAWLIDNEGTLYGDKFTESGFQSVELGMSREEVHRVLGDPIVRPWFQGAQGDPSEWWYAFQRKPGMNAHRRCIEFGPDDRVSGRISEPNID